MLNLDTNIVLHALTGTLTARESHLLKGDSWGLSAMVLWEFSKLFQLRRIVNDPSSKEFSAFLYTCTILPLSLEIAIASARLDFRSDPANEIIAATSIVHGIPLLTRDERILKSTMVPLAR